MQFLKKNQILLPILGVPWFSFYSLVSLCFFRCFPPCSAHFFPSHKLQGDMLGINLFAIESTMERAKHMWNREKTLKKQELSSQ